ncbi:MAG: DNA polymerase III subunit delta [Huintestinicola sp.]
MPLVTSKELDRIIKSGDHSSVYYIYGTDLYSVGQYKKALVSSIVKPGDEAYNLHEFQGKDFELEKFADVCEAFPMFADRLCVTVSDLDLESEKLKDDRMKLLLDTVMNLPETTTVVFFTANIDICDGKKYPTAKNKRLVDAVSKAGIVCEFKTKTKNDIVKEIRSLVSSAGCTIDDKAASVLCDRCLSDLMVISCEIEKLTAYVSGGNITAETVAMLTPESDDAKSYFLADAIAAGNMSLAMEIFNELVDMKNDPVYLLYVITGGMNDLYRARIALDNGKSASEVAEDFRYSKSTAFRIEKSMRSVRNVSTEHLRSCMELLTETDIRFKTGAGNESKTVLLEQAIVKMLTK